MTALNPTLDRLVLNVGGAGFVGMMMRARPFQDFLSFLGTPVPDPLEQQKLLATYQRPFDCFDPATYARYLLQEKLPGNPDKRVLMQAGLGDDEVPNLGTFLHARLVGVPLMQPAPWAPWGIPDATSGRHLGARALRLSRSATRTRSTARPTSSPMRTACTTASARMLERWSRCSASGTRAPCSTCAPGLA